MPLAGGLRARDAVEEWLRFHGCHDTLASMHRELSAFEEAQETVGGEALPSFEWRKKAEQKVRKAVIATPFPRPPGAPRPPLFLPLPPPPPC
jgi:hypothetical protein